MSAPTAIRPAGPAVRGEAPVHPGSRVRPALACIAAIVVLITLAVLSACIGACTVAPSTVMDAVFAFEPSNDEHLLVTHLRLPRAFLALVVGAGLGGAGVVMQSLSRNALAEPGLLGVNAGAALSVAAAIAGFGITHPTGHLLFALVGAALAGAGVLLLAGARRGSDPIRLVLAGAATTVVLGAGTQLVLLNAPEEVFDRFRGWMVGSLQGRDLSVLLPSAVLVVVGLGIAFGLTRSLDAAALGSDLGASLGVRTTAVWTLAGVAIVLLAGAGTAAAGPIVFIGLTAPHLARALVGHSHRRMLPAAIAIGALVLLGADVLGRVVARPGEVGVGIMAALIGGPFFVAFARRRKLVLA